MGRDLAWWRGLSEEEQEIWLARDHQRLKAIDDLLEWHHSKMADNEGIDVGSYFYLMTLKI